MKPGLVASLRFTYISEQYTDATNAKVDPTENLRGIERQIQAYYIMDLSFPYPFTEYLKSKPVS